MDQTPTTTAYPLAWPAGRPRTAPHKREAAAFKVPSFATARDELLAELRRLSARAVVLSTNVPLRRDGLPYSGQAQPDDPGAAVYFAAADGRQLAFACDRWRKVEDNLRAIAKTVEALRGIDRWGSGEMRAAAFSGFAALPPAAGPKTWWQVLGVGPDAPAGECERAYRRLVLDRHPDRGGSHEAMAELNAAWDACRSRR